MSAHHSHVSWPPRELHRGPQWETVSLYEDDQEEKDEDDEEACKLEEAEGGGKRIRREDEKRV